MSTLSNSRPVRAVAAWLCATFTIGCPATQVRPPERGGCPPELQQGMREYALYTAINDVILDINQPGDENEFGVYRDGPIVSRVVGPPVGTGPALPEGTLLYGRLWTEGLDLFGGEAVMGRYTEVQLPDGRRAPVCFILGDRGGLIPKLPGSKPGAAVLHRRYSAFGVDQWP